MIPEKILLELTGSIDNLDIGIAGGPRNLKQKIIYRKVPCKDRIVFPWMKLAECASDVDRLRKGNTSGLVHLHGTKRIAI